MTKKTNLATALHKAPRRRSKDESSSGTAEASREALMEVTSTAVQEEVSTARATPFDFIPAIGHFLSKAVYGTFYYASYGVVFTAVKITHWLPTDNAMAHGFQDGAAAAKADFQQWQAHHSAAKTHASNERDPASAGEFPATA